MVLKAPVAQLSALRATCTVAAQGMLCHCSIAKTMTAPTKRVWDVASEQCHYNAMEMMVVYVCAQVNTVYTNMQYKYIDIHVSDKASMILYLDYCCLMGAIT